MYNFLVTLIEDSPSDVPLVKFFQNKYEFCLYCHLPFIQTHINSTKSSDFFFLKKTEIQYAQTE